MIAIIDYGMGNLFSIQNMLKHIEIDTIITSDKNKIKNADHLIVPGVGKFDEGMRNLQEKGLDSVISSEAGKGKPILGICLGMQLLGNSSEEGELGGLCLVKFRSVRFKFDKLDCCDSLNRRKIPHMGWERVDTKDCPLTKDLSEQQRYYFVHSYHAVCEDEDTVIITCNYGYKFAAAVRNQNVYGVQFHPEKSHKYGMKILKNFAEIKYV